MNRFKNQLIYFTINIILINYEIVIILSLYFTTQINLIYDDIVIVLSLFDLNVTAAVSRNKLL